MKTGLLKNLVMTLLFCQAQFLATSIATAQDLSEIGGDLTSDNTTIAQLQVAAPNLASQSRISLQFSGHSVFHLPLDLPDTPIKKMKVGASFNHTTCGGCHINDGQGPVKFDYVNGSIPQTAGDIVNGSPMLIKVSLKGLLKNGVPKDIAAVGDEQLQDHTVDGKNKFNIGLSWVLSQGLYTDGAPYELRKPKITFTIPKVRSSDVVTSLRRTPILIGMGLLEAVPNETIVAMADPLDKNKDGISGKVNYVKNKEHATIAIGRFGFRASHSSLREQAGAALFNDMGVTNKVISGGSKKIELSDHDLKALTFYMQASGIPRARNQDDPTVIAGKGIFKAIGCDACHVMTLKTAKKARVPELSNQTFHPFTDLLLHNMGSGLADKRPEFSASGSEWRTTPLWGIGLTERLSSEAQGYLHDGRARTIEEAILWHDGEGKRAKQRFRALSATERDQLITFLRSI